MRQPRHILITGATSGIGAALAGLYAAPDIRLALHGRNPERLAAIARLCQQRGATVDTHNGDVTDREDMKAWIQACDARQPLDLIIANAGISAASARLDENSEQTLFDINVNGVLNTVRPAVSLMAQRRQGQIAIVSSLASFKGFAGSAAYSASKAAIRIYGEALRAELLNKNIAVSVICPGFIKTPMTDVNRFAMPMIISADRAAEIIRQGLAHNQPRIAFPLPMYLAVRLLAALPQSLIDRLAPWLPKKA